jgi:alcohol dehydrogenase class IV
VREHLEARLAKAGVELASLRTIEKPPGEPTIDMIRAAAARLADGRCRRLVAIGGGSVLDWARLAWAESEGLLGEAGASEVLRNARRRDLELCLVPTTCATGAEATGVAVYSGKDALIPVLAPAFVADRVILDGGFLAGVDASQVSLWLCDALSHAVEAYLSIVPGRLAKAAALSALTSILETHPEAPSASRNERLMEAAYLAGVAVGNCSVGVIHAFAHTLSLHGVGHAAGNALGLVAGLEANAAAKSSGELWRRAGASSHHDLIEGVRSVVRSGAVRNDGRRVAELIRDGSTRERLLDQMAADPCLRSNPIRLERDALERFLDRVLEAAVEA